MKVPLFLSPWAENVTSEQFFATTVEELGRQDNTDLIVFNERFALTLVMIRAVGSDQGLATLYTTLILATPGAHLSHSTKVKRFVPFLSTILSDTN